MHTQMNTTNNEINITSISKKLEFKNIVGIYATKILKQALSS